MPSKKALRQEVTRLQKTLKTSALILQEEVRQLLETLEKYPNDLYGIRLRASGIHLEEGRICRLAAKIDALDHALYLDGRVKPV